MRIRSAASVFERLDQQRGAGLRVAVAFQGQVDVDTGYGNALRPSFAVRNQRARRQAEVAGVPVVVVRVAEAALDLRVARKAAQRPRGDVLAELGERVEPEPRVAVVAPVAPPEAGDRDLLPSQRLDLDREPVLVVPVDLGVEVRGSPRRGKRRGRGEDVEQQPAVGILVPPLEQRLAPILQQIVRAAGIASRGGPASARSRPPAGPASQKTNRSNSSSR